MEKGDFLDFDYTDESESDGEALFENREKSDNNTSIEERGIKKSSGKQNRVMKKDSGCSINRKNIVILAVIAILLLLAIFTVKIGSNRVKFNVAQAGTFNENTVDSDIYHKNDRVISVLGTDESKIEAADKTLDENIYMVGDAVHIPITINTKADIDGEYKDFKSYLEISMVGAEFGYDNVIKYIDAYNDNSSSKIDMPSKEELYESSTGLEIVAYKMQLRYPEDYPTYESKGNVFKIPAMMMEIKGKFDADTVEANEDLDENKHIVVGDNIYNIQGVVDASVLNTIGKDEEERINISETLEYTFITYVPSGITTDDYEIIVKLYEDRKDTDNSISETRFYGLNIGELVNEQYNEGDVEEVHHEEQEDAVN